MTSKRTDVAAVVLTTGSRPQELEAAVESIFGSVGCEVLVVWNSTTEPTRQFEHQSSVTLVSPGSNLGIPGGRSFGARELTSDYVVFLDDDAELASTKVDTAIVEHFTAHPMCAVVAFGIIDEVGVQSRRHNPRVGSRGAGLPGPVGTFLGGACAIRRSAFEQVGGYDASFVYAMEEQDLSWRLWDAGWEVHYRPDIVVNHPRTDPSRHRNALMRTWQNRVTAARRSLPLPIRAIHLGLHGARAVKMGLSPKSLLEVLLRHPRPSDAKSMSWRTVARLTRIGRPPIL
jgi:GT2 family glycosyltransferase